MRPLPAPLLAEPPDPLPDAVGEAMRDATVSLWRDLWQKVSTYDESFDRIVRVIDCVERAVNESPVAHRDRLRRRLARARTDLEAVRTVPIPDDRTGNVAR